MNNIKNECKPPSPIHESSIDSTERDETPVNSNRKCEMSGNEGEKDQAKELLELLAKAGNQEYSKPPEFVKSKATFKQWKLNISRWQLVTSTVKANQGVVIMMGIPQEHPLREQLELEVGEAVANNEDGVTLIVDAVEAIYGEDTQFESYGRYREFESLQRKVGQDVMEYLTEFKRVYGRVKEYGFNLDGMEKMLAFKFGIAWQC